MSNQDHIIKNTGDISKEVQLLLETVTDVFGRIFDSCDTLESLAKSGDIGQERARNCLAQIYEAGSQQDVIRQRLEKIDRIAARIADPSLPEDDILLRGPQDVAQDGMSQDDINRMLEGDD